MNKLKLRQFKWLSIMLAKNPLSNPDLNITMTPVVEMTWSLSSFSDPFWCSFFTASEFPSLIDHAASEIARGQGTDWLLLIRLKNNNMVAFRAEDDSAHQS